ncbi:ATP-binding cassette domain-containing protein [Streptomyces sp. SID486]|uniref:ATP-binding cassette domain-containing protein n=1 Tax=Streptomyces sp. SID486 TaxID=2690264 RepID=UPI001367A4C4|nr:ATP-binding cassette domain-containing protein [Streptomyces sp. SID486]
MIQAFGLTSNPRKAHPPAVDDISFEARAGHVTALLGGAGAGKTTTLRLMLELQHGRGITYFRDRPLHRIPHPSREVGVLLGDVPGHPARSVRGHLRMLCAASGVPARRADEVLEVVGLVSLREERLGTLSRGMDRRLGLACALLPDPHTLVLDEPADGVSAREAQWLHGMLRAHANQGGTVLFTTADPKEAARTADRVVTIDGGRLVADQEARAFARTRLRPRVAVRSPHATRLAALLTKDARTARRSVEVVREGGNRLSVYGSTTADVGEIAYRHGILVHQLADEVGDMGPGAGADGDGGASASEPWQSEQGAPRADRQARPEHRAAQERPAAPDARRGEPERAPADPSEPAAVRAGNSPHPHHDEGRPASGTPAPERVPAGECARTEHVHSSEPQAGPHRTAVASDPAAGAALPSTAASSTDDTTHDLMTAAGQSRTDMTAAGASRTDMTAAGESRAGMTAAGQGRADRTATGMSTADRAAAGKSRADMTAAGRSTADMTAPGGSTADAAAGEVVGRSADSPPARGAGPGGSASHTESRTGRTGAPAATIAAARALLPGARNPGVRQPRTGHATRHDGARTVAASSSPLPPPICVRPAPSPLRPLRYELRRAAGVGTGFLTCGAVLIVSALTAVLLARIGHTPQARLFAAWPRQLPLPPAALAAGLLGALAFGDEFRHPALAADRGTVPRRLGLLTAKLLVSGGTAVLIAFLTVGCDAEVLYIVYGRAMTEVPADWLAATASWFGLVVGCAWAGVLAAGVFRSTTAGLAAVLAVPVLVVPVVHKALQGPAVRMAADFPLRMREVLLLQWPFGGERYLLAVARVLTQPVGSALALSLTGLLCAYLLTVLRTRWR